MVSRRQMLVASLLVSAVLHALIWHFAPRITLLQGSSELPGVLQRFRVDLVSLPTATAVAKPADDPSPGRAADAEVEAEAPLQPEDILAPAVVPEMMARAQTNPLTREFEPEAAAEQAAIADARILQIAEETARRDIEIARTLVAPGGGRILPDGATPVLRGPSEGIADDVLMVDPLATVFGRDGAQQDGSQPAPLAEPMLDMLPETLPAGLPELPVEEEAVRAPVLQGIEQDRSADSMDDLIVVELATYLPPDGKQGYFRVRLVPRPEAASQSLPKDVTYVVDASSSIVQRKLDLAVRGILSAVQQLAPDDRFNVVIFRDSASVFRSAPVPATDENRQALGAFLKGMESKGETDVYTALEPVIEQQARPGMPAVVVVVSDGRPTTGLKDGRAIINALSAENDGDQSIFAVTAGKTVNRYLLDLLAYRNKGEAVVSDNIEDMSGLLTQFSDSIRNPLLVGLNASYGRVNESEVFPKSLPDLYASRALAVYGVFTPGATDALAVRVRGEAGEREKDVVFSKTFADAITGGPEIARGWAFQKIYHLIGEMSRVGETPELLSEVRALSRQYGIRTSYDD